MKFLKYVLFLVLIGFIGMAIYVAVQPNDFDVTMTKNINAPKAVVFEMVSDSTNTDWSSFWKSSEKLQKSTVYGNDSIHQIFSSNRIKKSELKWVFTANPDGSTTVTRSLEADKISFMTKVKYALFGNKENELAQQFSTDLEKLDKNVVVSMTRYTITVNGITDYGGGFYMYNTISSSSNNIIHKRNEQIDQVKRFMKYYNITPSGNPFTLYIDRNPENGNVIMTNAIPVREKVIVAEDSNILCGFMDRTIALKVTVEGNYSNLEEAWTTARKYIDEHDFETTELKSFEVYKNDPAEIVNPAKWITEIYIPIQEKPEIL